MANVRHRRPRLPGASRAVTVLVALIATVAAGSVVVLDSGATAGAVVPANGGVSGRALLGRSIDGRPIYAYRMGSPYAPTKAVVLGNTHGDETAGITVADAIIHGKGVHAVDLWVIPTMNPDGTAAHRHGSARGVDLNRNFPYHWARLSGYHYSGTGAMSEPETRIIMNFLNRVKPRYIVSMHQPLDGVDTTDGGARDPTFRHRLASNLALPQKPFTCFGVCHGTMTGWFTHYHTGAAIVVEFPASVSGSYLTGRAAPGIIKAIGARYDTTADHNPFGHVDSVSANGATVTFSGWALDPDIRTGSMLVRVSEGASIRWQRSTSIYRKDINTIFHASGNHGFEATITAANGTHTYCVTLINHGAGNASPRYCYRVTVGG
jgi:protein MpaA